MIGGFARFPSEKFDLDPANKRWFDTVFYRGLGMSRRRRRVFIENQKGRRSAGFSVDERADAADVSLALRRRGWIAYRLRLEPENYAWVAIVIDWQRVA